MYEKTCLCRRSAEVISNKLSTVLGQGLKTQEADCDIVLLNAYLAIEN